MIQARNVSSEVHCFQVNCNNIWTVEVLECELSQLFTKVDLILVGPRQMLKEQSRADYKFTTSSVVPITLFPSYTINNISYHLGTRMQRSRQTMFTTAAILLLSSR
jgi:hypothetical protein